MSELICWLNAEIDAEDMSLNTCFEEQMSLLYQMVSSTEFLSRLLEIEGHLLYQRIKPSTRQTARFWLLAGKRYAELQRNIKAFDAFELCGRGIGEQDSEALLVLHSEWGLVADDLGDQFQAQVSYEKVIKITRLLSNNINACIQATEDNPIYLRALNNRLRYLILQ